jgi:hypothetical protein
VERLLITKLVRRGDRAELYARGHQFKDLTLFALSDLADLGVDYAGLPEGVEVPCRFWAYWQESGKLNRANRPYKDVVSLEAVSAPATATSTDNSALLAEVRAVRKLLAALVEAQGLAVKALGGEDPATGAEEPASGAEDVEGLDQAFPRFGDGELVSDAALPYFQRYREAERKVPQDVAELRAWVKAAG